MITGIDSPIERIAKQPEFLAAAQRLGRLNNFRSVLAIVRQWCVIAGAAAAAIYTNSIVIYGLAIVIIACRQQALASVMHEATHHRLFSNRQVNDCMANLFCALPIGLVLSRYSDEHIRHHYAPNTDRDPYWLIFRANPKCWCWPKSKFQALWLLISDTFSLNSLINAKDVGGWTPWPNHFSKKPQPVPLPMSERLMVYVFFPSVALIVVISGAWYYVLILWILPILTVGQLFVRVRAIAEHTALPEIYGTDATRHVDAHWLEQLLICPLNINYHLVHHIFPYIPYYNLPIMHKLLCENADFRRRAHISKTYLGRSGVLRGELVATSGA